MKQIESVAKTVEDAITSGLETLSVSISDVSIDILDEGSKGLFGLFGSRQAKVRLTLKEDMDDLLTDVKKETPKAAPPPKPRNTAQPERKTTATTDAAQTKRAPEPTKERPQPRAAVKAPEKRRQPVAVTPIEPRRQIEKRPQVIDLVASNQAAERAVAFLVEMTKLMNVGIEATAKVDEDGNVFINIVGDSLGILIGRRGETLDALQYLTSLYVNKGLENYIRITLDTENYRAKREEALTRLANRMASRAVKTGRRVSLEPMNPYERRIIHSALQGNEAVDTHSEGEEPNRHLVITLKKA